MADIEKVDMNSPAFGEGSEVKTVEPTVVEPAKVEEPVESVEENKVPYSRFKKFHDEALQYKAEAEEWKRKAETYKPEKEESVTDLPSHWVKLYGDSDASREAWKIQSEQNEAIKREAYEAGLKGAEEFQQQQALKLEKNVETIDRELDTLTDFVGRKLTDKEQEAILDIVDQFTPKDGYGNYVGSMIPFDKAWEVYELRQGMNSNSKKQARDNVASISGSPSQGVPSGEQAERDKNFNPLDWDAARRRLQGL